MAPKKAPIGPNNKAPNAELLSIGLAITHNGFELRAVLMPFIMNNPYLIFLVGNNRILPELSYILQNRRGFEDP